MASPEGAGITLYGIVNCDTVKRARAWMQVHRPAGRFHDFKRLGVPVERLDAWIEAVGWERLVNRQGTTWRRLEEGERVAIRDAPSARRALLANPSLIKRPVVEWEDGTVTVGFESARWPPG